MIKIKVDGSVVSVQETQALYCGSQDVYTCSFTFDTGWERFSKSAVFRVNGKTVTILLDENGECVLPWELLVRSNIGQEIWVGMYGVSSDAEILTSVWGSIGTVREGSELGNDAREPSAGVYEQVMANVQRVDEKVDNYNTEVQTQVQRAESAAAVALGSAESATESARTAKNGADVAEGAMGAVREALANIPEGSTLVINDLTTGGTAAALSAEMGKVLGVRPNPNLLHNWYFANPVNQRGQTEYSGSGYTIDRWEICHKTASVQVVDGGIQLIDSTPGYLAFRQRLENYEQYLGKTLTLSCMITEISGTGTLVASFSSDSSDRQSVDFDKAGVHSVTFTVPSNAQYLQIIFATRSGFGYATIKAVKLEIGGTQTLAHKDSTGAWVLNEVPDYSEELAKCQRYQMVYNLSKTLLYWTGGAPTKDVALFSISLPCEMRVKPSITADTAAFVLRNGGTSYSISAISVYAVTGNEFILRVDATGLLTAGAAYLLRCAENTQIILDANL